MLDKKRMQDMEKSMPDCWRTEKEYKAHGYSDCECCHSSLHHKFPNFFRWLWGNIKGNYHNESGECSICDCQKFKRDKIK